MPDPKTAKVKNISGEDLIDAWSGGRLVLAGAALDVPVDQVWGYTQQAERWEPVDAAAKKVHKEHYDAAVEREAAELAAVAPDPEAEQRAAVAAAEEPATPVVGATEKQED